MDIYEEHGYTYIPVRWDDLGELAIVCKDKGHNVLQMSKHYGKTGHYDKAQALRDKYRRLKRLAYTLKNVEERT